MTIEYATTPSVEHIPGDFRRNTQGRPWVGKALYYRPSDWPFDDWSGVDPIFANRGTWVHTLTEYIDTDQEVPDAFIAAGVELGIAADLQHHIADRYATFRQAHGLVARHVEVKVVNDTHRVAGTVDRIDEATQPIVTPFGTIEPGDLVVVDIKTGSRVVKASYAAQLAMYADAVPYDVDTCERGEW